MMTLISIGEAANILGVTPKTLRDWERKGRISPDRTPNGHRRYNQDDILRLAGIIKNSVGANTEFVTVAYARVSSRDQKGDLLGQVELLESFCAANGWEYQIIQDIGAGLNYEKRGLKKLIKDICERRINRLVLTHREMLLRFGAEILFSLCEINNVEVVIMNRGDNKPSFEEELAQDVLEIITVFSARLYGARSHQSKKMMDKLNEACHDFGSQN